MERGEVHLIPFHFPDGTTKDKFVVVLRGGPRAAGEDQVPIVVASTDKRPHGAPLRRFDVAVGVAEGFAHATIIDCRWPATILAASCTPQSHKFTLPAGVMQKVSIALVEGLQMVP